MIDSCVCVFDSIDHTDPLVQRLYLCGVGQQGTFMHLVQQRWRMGPSLATVGSEPRHRRV